MNSYGFSEDHQPLTWVRGYPIYTAHAIVAAYIVSMLATTLFMATGIQGPFAWLPFTSERVLGGEVWRFVTYGFLNPPSIWFAIDMVMIAWFGRELEKFFGRGKFLFLFAALYLSSPLVLTVVGLWQPTSLAGRSGSFALFIAFATLYPNVAFFFNILAKWLALILVGLYTLMALSSHDTLGLITLWTTVGIAFAFVRYQQGHLTLPNFGKTRGPSRDEAPAKPARKAPVENASERAVMEEVDALLDKIAQSGMGSLTPKERAKLDAARGEMMKKRGR